MSNDNHIERPPAIVFSCSLEGRNTLRVIIGKCGFNAVCFGSEAICFDNFKPIQPNIVIAETDSSSMVWRFIFAMHAAGILVPLVVISDRLSAEQFEAIECQMPITVIGIHETMDYIKKHSFEVIKPQKNRLPILVGQTSAIKDIRSLLPSISETRDAVLITGERGTGKEFLIRLIAGLSGCEECFIKIDCRELQPDMLINGLFDKVFESRIDRRPAAIFLEHLDELSAGSQAEMLLLMDAQLKSGNGANSDGDQSVRFFSSAGKNIEDIVRQGKFRKDLFYRLNVIPIAMPALRERREDIPLLMDYFVLEACAEQEKCITIPSMKAKELCRLHNWPGNMIELQRQMYRFADTGSESFLFANTDMPKMNMNARQYLSKLAAVDDLPEIYEIKSSIHDLNNLSLKRICDKFVSRTEKRLMKKALESTNWNRKKAAELLNISYKSMLNKMKAYDII